MFQIRRGKRDDLSSCPWLAEARYMHYFSGVSGGVNFCKVFAFSSFLSQRADRQDSAFRGILVDGCPDFL